MAVIRMIQQNHIAYNAAGGTRLEAILLLAVGWSAFTVVRYWCTQVFRFFSTRLIFRFLECTEIPVKAVSFCLDWKCFSRENRCVLRKKHFFQCPRTSHFIGKCLFFDSQWWRHPFHRFIFFRKSRRSRCGNSHATVAMWLHCYRIDLPWAILQFRGV